MEGESGGSGESEVRFAAYVESLAGVLGHADRVAPLKDYCTGLLMPGERKSVEPMASIIAPARAAAAHQSLLHFVGQSAWSDEAMLDKVRELAAPAFDSSGGVEAWIVDDTGFQKKGAHSVGVARQYCGRLGKTDNCQIAVTLSLANHHVSLVLGLDPRIAYRLYLPEIWANDAGRRAKAHVPENVEFRTKPRIALSQIEAALAAGVAKGVVLADAGYGSDGAFRGGLTRLGLIYAVGVQSTLSVWRPGEQPLPPDVWSGRGRRPSRLRRDKAHRPVSAKELAIGLPAEAWKDVEWREGSNQTLSSRFAALRIRPASRDWRCAEPHPLEWLIVEWPQGEPAPTKYWLSTLPEDIPLEALVDTVKLRWRIERDYEELKSELGLAHFEGRGWRGFHHHASLCIAAYRFLILERSAFPPSDPLRREGPAVSPRGRSTRTTPSPRTTRSKLDRHDAQAFDDRPGEIALSMSVLSRHLKPAQLRPSIVTQ
jgi:SRSO17 transposase